MHYGDKKVIEKAVLQVVIYKHENLCRKKGEEKYHPVLCSIQKCQYIHPMLVEVFLHRWEYSKFDKEDKKFFKQIEPEKFYLITLGYDKSGCLLEIKKIQKTDGSGLHGLH